tara:strand:- start:4074 stop:6221 length:2148 start_codon:yes stop_codon:yes gene_type:complete
MPTKIPLRATYDASGNVATGLSEYQTNEFISTTFGGTGANTYAQGEILVGNASGSLTKSTIQGTAGQITVTTGGNTVTIGLDSSLGFNTATKNILGTVKVPDRLAVTEFCSNISGGTGYSDANNVLTRGGAVGSSGLTVNISTDNSGGVCSATVVTSGTRYAVDDVITITRAVSNLETSTPTPSGAWKTSTTYSNVSSTAEVCTGIETVSDLTPTPSGVWQCEQTYNNVAPSQNSGSGNGALFTISTGVDGNPLFVLSNAGNGYTIGDTLQFTDPGDTSNTASFKICTLLTASGVSAGAGATFDITTDSSGDPTLSVNSGGQSYIKTDQIVVTEPTGSLINLSDTTPTEAEGTLSCYWQPNQNTVVLTQCATSGSGTGASFNVTTDNNGNPTFVLNNIGQDYKIGETITIVDGGTTSETATLTVSCANDSYISNVWQSSVTHSSIAPSSTSGSGTGSTFSATTDTNGFPTFAIVGGGSDYVVGDTVTITEPTGVLTVFSTLPEPSDAWEPNQSHTGVSQHYTAGNGTGISVNITTDGDGNPSFTLVDGGAGYAMNDQIRFTDPHSNTTSCATLVVTSIIVQATAILTVKTINSGAITAISNTIPIKRSTAIVSSSNQDATANVKTISNGGLAVDSQGNLSIAKLVGMSDGAIFNNNNTYLEVITRLDIDEGGRVTNIDKKEMQFKDGVQLKQNDNGTMQVQSDGLAVAMSIVFGG